MYKKVRCDNNNINGKEQRYRKRVFLYHSNLVLLKLSCHKFKTLIIIPKVTTKKFLENTEKARKGELKWYSTSKQLNERNCTLGELRNINTYKTYRKQIDK